MKFRALTTSITALALGASVIAAAAPAAAEDNYPMYLRYYDVVGDTESLADSNGYVIQWDKGRTKKAPNTIVFGGTGATPSDITWTTDGAGNINSYLTPTDNTYVRTVDFMRNNTWIRQDKVGLALFDAGVQAAGINGQTWTRTSETLTFNQVPFIDYVNSDKYISSVTGKNLKNGVRFTVKENGKTIIALNAKRDEETLYELITSIRFTKHYRDKTVAGTTVRFTKIGHGNDPVTAPNVPQEAQTAGEYPNLANYLHLATDLLETSQMVKTTANSVSAELDNRKTTITDLRAAVAGVIGETSTYETKWSKRGVRLTTSAQAGDAPSGYPDPCVRVVISKGKAVERSC